MRKNTKIIYIYVCVCVCVCSIALNWDQSTMGKARVGRGSSNCTLWGTGAAPSPRLPSKWSLSLGTDRRFQSRDGDVWGGGWARLLLRGCRDPPRSPLGFLSGLIV